MNSYFTLHMLYTRSVCDTTAPLQLQLPRVALNKCCSFTFYGFLSCRSLCYCRMKQEMIDCVHEAAQDFRTSTSRTMANTTKRTLSENVAIEAQLAKMNEKTTEVHHDNQSLRRHVVAQKHQVRRHCRRGPVVRTSVFGWRTFPDQWLTCDHFVG